MKMVRAHCCCRHGDCTGFWFVNPVQSPSASCISAVLLSPGPYEHLRHTETVFFSALWLSVCISLVVRYCFEETLSYCVSALLLWFCISLKWFCRRIEVVLCPWRHFTVVSHYFVVIFSFHYFCSCIHLWIFALCCGSFVQHCKVTQSDWMNLCNFAFELVC